MSYPLKKSLRGVSLVEALLALVVMAVGMLAVVGVQATLRSNADLSRQRAEAVRIAQRSLEAMRSFSRIEADATLFDFADIVNDTEVFSPTATNALNAEYTRTGNVNNNWPGMRTLTMRVTWRDRTGQQDAAGRDSFVELHSAVAAVAPELAGSLALPPQGSPARLPRGRNAAIPPTALIQPDGTSKFIPPQTTTTQVSWYFNNITGLITRICTDASDLSTCSSATSQLLTGYVRFALQLSQPTAADTVNPPSSFVELLPIIRPAVTLDAQVRFTTSINPTVVTSACFVGATTNEIAAPTEYFCALPLAPNLPGQVPTWTGRLGFSTATTPDRVTANAIDSSNDRLRVCRYFDLAGTGDYTNIGQPLSNQNYFVIRAGSGIDPAFVCPAAVTAAHPAN